MEIKYGESLEFAIDGGPAEPTVSLEKEEALRQIIRHGFRAPVGISQEITLTIAGHSYAVFNLSGSGVGIYLNAPGQFEEQTRLVGMSLSLGGQSFVVEGTVVHLSSDGAHHLCGIEWNSMSAECQDVILDFLKKSRNALFT